MSNLDDFIEGKETAIGTGLLGLGGAALYQGTIGQLPQGGYRNLLANQASNFLEGFYKPGADKQALYRAELQKAIVRSGKTLANPMELATYKGTGVSSFLNDTILDMDGELAQIDEKYAKGDYGESGDTALKRAKTEKNRIVKERHYKILNDSANTEIFDGKKSRSIESYKNRTYKKGMTPWHEITNSKDFVRNAGNKNIAEYVLNRHNIGASELPVVGKAFKKKKLKIKTPNLKYLKWFDHSISGVMRGGMFNPQTYHLLEGLKNSKVNLEMASDIASKVKGVSGVKRMNNKLYFSFSPVWKSNFDWGGYNVVAEWDPSTRGKVRFIGTDLRDTPVSTLTRGKHVINYVESKQFNIADLKEEAIKKPRTGATRGESKNPVVRRTNQALKDAKTAGRLNDLATGKLDSGGVYPQIKHDINQIASERSRYKQGITVKNLGKKLSRMKLGGKATGLVGATLLAKMAYDKWGKNDYAQEVFSDMDFRK